MLGSDENRLYYVCLGVSMTCLSVALSLSNSAVAVKHVWNFGWLGCLVAFIICCCSPDSRTRADAAKLVGVGICVSFYVTKHGYFELLCNVFFCEMPLEVLALATFLVVQCWFWRQKTLRDKSSKIVGLRRAGSSMGRPTRATGFVTIRSATRKRWRILLSRAVRLPTFDFPKHICFQSVEVSNSPLLL